MSLTGPRVLVSVPCECGDVMHWRRKGILSAGWRLECFCGRAGPWRNRPETEIANPFRASAPTAPPPPKPKR